MSPRLLWLLRQLHPVRGTYIGSRQAASDVMAACIAHRCILRSVTYVRGPQRTAA